MLGIILDMTQKHQHLPSPQMAPNIYKKIEMRCYETITKEHFLLNDSATQEIYGLKD